MRSLPLLLLMALAAAAPARSTRDRLLTPEQLQSLYASRQYREALRQTTRALALKDEAARAYDRHALLRLVAECHLRLGENGKAAEAFAAAASAAPDPTAAATDRACEVLAKRSKGTKFQPLATARAGGKPGEKAGGKKAAAPAARPPPIDISDPANRAAAFAALLEETAAAARSRLAALANPRSLDDLYQVLKTTNEWRTAELVSTGETTDATAAAGEFADKAFELMRARLEEAARTYDRLEEVAWLPADPVPNEPDKAFTRGLVGEEIDRLRDVLRDSKKVVLLSEEFALQLGETGPGHRWEALIEEAKAVQAPADEMSEMMGGVGDASSEPVSKPRRR